MSQNCDSSEENYKWELLPDDYTKYDMNFKIIVIGDSGVGKSCLTNKATKNIFEESYNASVGFLQHPHEQQSDKDANMGHMWSRVISFIDNKLL